MAKTTAEKLAKAKEKLKTAQSAGGDIATVREAKKKVKRAQRRARVEKAMKKKREGAKTPGQPKPEA